MTSQGFPGFCIGIGKTQGKTMWSRNQDPLRPHVEEEGEQKQPLLSVVEAGEMVVVLVVMDG